MSTTSSQPNVIFLFCDQLRADALGCYGNNVVATPHLDALAAQGTVFDSCYTPSPVCVPARCSLISGVEPQGNECYDNGFPMPERTTLMNVLTGAGYRTHGIGKMHFRPDGLRGFDSRDLGEEFGDVDCDDYLRHVADEGYGHVERPLGLRSEMYYVPQLSPVPEELHNSTWVADRTLAFLDAHESGEGDSEQPFFCWSSFIAPHPPFSPPSPWHRLYRPSLLPEPHVPERSAELLTTHNIFQNRYKFTDGGKDRNLIALRQAYYYASVSFVDHQVGRIVAELERRGLRDNTILILSADHGEFLGDYGCFGKRSFLDSAARIPLIISGPGWAAERRSEPVSLVDILPTLAGIAGATDQIPEDVDGMDLATAPDRVGIFGQFQARELGLYCVVTDDYKYIYSAADAREYLIDRVRDPLETSNLSHNPYHRKTLAYLRGLVQAHFDDLADVDLAEVTGNRPIPLGPPPNEKSVELLGQLSRSADAGVLVLGDPLEPSSDNEWLRYRDLVQPPDAGLAKRS